MIEARRVEATPRRLASASCISPSQRPAPHKRKAARAVELAITKYCSVRSSLSADAPVTWTVNSEDIPTINEQVRRSFENENQD